MILSPRLHSLPLTSSLPPLRGRVAQRTALRREKLTVISLSSNIGGGVNSGKIFLNFLVVVQQLGVWYILVGCSNFYIKQGFGHGDFRWGYINMI